MDEYAPGLLPSDESFDDEELGDDLGLDGRQNQELDTLLRAIPEGWTRAEVDGQTWGVTRATRAGGKVISINAERLGDIEQLGANVWITSDGPVLRPCEVPAGKVLRFLRAAAMWYST